MINIKLQKGIPYYSMKKRKEYQT